MKRLAILFAALAGALAVAAPAMANVYVSRGQTVSEIRVIGQDVTVNGVARGPVIVIGGNLTVGPHGRVANATVVFGAVHAAPGSQFVGDVFQFGGPTPQLNGWLLALVVLLAYALRTVLYGIAIWLGRRLARTRYQPTLLALASERPGRTLIAGILASVGLLALSAIALLTIAGILVSLIIWALLMVALIVGLAVVVEPLAELRLNRGVYLLAAIPVLGDSLLALATAIGVGVALRRLSAQRLPQPVHVR
jgi:hypothetical protein